MEKENLLNQFVLSTKDILGNVLIGVYLHGSYAMGCYNFYSSDIDLIVVINRDISDDIKNLYMEEIVKFSDEIGGSGIEISVVKEEFCNKDIYLIPFELHFSDYHLEEYQKNASKYISDMKGLDEDLPAHFKMIYHRGKKLYGKEIEDVFADVSDKYYLKSVLYDLKDYQNECISKPGYVVLNVCRTLAYLRQGLLLSKLEGGEWALDNLDKSYDKLVSDSLQEYKCGEKLNLDKKLSEKLVDATIEEIESRIL